MRETRRIQVLPYLPPGAARVYDSAPGVLFVGTAVAEHWVILPLLIEQDRERLIQEQTE